MTLVTFGSIFRKYISCHGFADDLQIYLPLEEGVDLVKSLLKPLKVVKLGLAINLLKLKKKNEDGPFQEFPM